MLCYLHIFLQSTEGQLACAWFVCKLQKKSKIDSLWSLFEDFGQAIRSCVSKNKPSLEDIQSFVLLRLKLFFSALLAKITYRYFLLLITLTSKYCVIHVHEAFDYFYVKRRIRNLLITYQHCNDRIKFQHDNFVITF